MNLAVHAESLGVWVGVGDAVRAGRLCLARHLVWVRVRVGVGLRVGARVRGRCSVWARACGYHAAVATASGGGAGRRRRSVDGHGRGAPG